MLLRRSPILALSLAASASAADFKNLTVGSRTPLAQEICGDSIDNDQDGDIDEECMEMDVDTGLASERLPGGHEPHITINVVQSPDDGETEIKPCDQDGGCLAITVPRDGIDAGAVLVLEDGDLYSSSSTVTPSLILRGEKYDQAGAAVANAPAMGLYDVDTFLVGAPGNDQVYVVDDLSYTGSQSLSDIAAIWSGGTDFGRTMASLGDVNGDGYADAMVSSDGGVALVYGPLDQDLTISSSTAWTLSGSSGSELGASVAGVGDVNGDGLEDFAVGAPGDGSDRGAVYLFLGDTSGAAGIGSLASAEAVWTGEALGDRAGEVVAGLGDIDGDGFDDWGIAAPRTDWGGTDAGTIYVVYGGTSVSAGGSLWGADLIVDGESAGDGLGARLAGGDLNGDGESELVVSAPGADDGGTDSGAAYVIFSPGTGLATLGTVGNTLYGAPGDALGASMAVFDTNDDGLADPIMLHASGDLTILSGKLF